MSVADIVVLVTREDDPIHVIDCGDEARADWLVKVLNYLGISASAVVPIQLDAIKPKKNKGGRPKGSRKSRNGGEAAQARLPVTPCPTFTSDHPDAADANNPAFEIAENMRRT